MKRGIFLISFLLLMISPVYAKENRLYFTETDDRLYYESELFDNNTFMKHTDMTPGSKYQDTLKIENGTRINYELYMKAVPKTNNGQIDELLENIEMKITLDDRVIYAGDATGQNLEAQGIDLQNAIILGVFIPKKTSIMKVDTKLKESYSNVDNNSTSKVDWVFYASYDDSGIDIINPSTMAQGTKYNMSLFWIVLSIVIILIGWFRIKERSQYTKSKKLLQKR